MTMMIVRILRRRGRLSRGAGRISGRSGHVPEVSFVVMDVPLGFESSALCYSRTLQFLKNPFCLP